MDISEVLVDTEEVVIHRRLGLAPGYDQLNPAEEELTNFFDHPTVCQFKDKLPTSFKTFGMLLSTDNIISCRPPYNQLRCRLRPQKRAKRFELLKQ